MAARVRWRGSTAERGYGAAHQKLRGQWKSQVDSGMVACHAIICLEVRDGRSRLIAPGTPWHLGHTADRSGWTGPEHQRCGAADGARRGNRRRGMARQVKRQAQARTIAPISVAPLRTSRDW